MSASIVRIRGVHKYFTRGSEQIDVLNDLNLDVPEGEFLGQWTGMGGPNDITRGKDGNFYIAEQEDGVKPAYVCVRDANGSVLARLESRHVHGVGVDSHGNIYAGLTVNRSVDKFVRQH